MYQLTKRSLMSLAAAVTLVASTTNFAQGVEGTQTDDNCPECVEESVPDWSRPVTDPDEFDKSVTTVQEDIKSNELRTSTDIEQFNFEKATVLDVQNDGQRFQSVTIPVSGYSPLSNFTVVYNEDGSVSNYAETHFYEGGDGNFAVDQWSDGSFERTKNLDAEFIPDKKFEAEIEKVREQSIEPTVQPQGIGKVATCLATIAGIGGPVAYVIAGACAGACAFPEPTVSKGVCAACIGAYAALGAGGMGAAAACFQLW